MYLVFAASNYDFRGKIVNVKYNGSHLLIKALSIFKIHT